MYNCTFIRISILFCVLQIYRSHTLIQRSCVTIILVNKLGVLSIQMQGVSQTLVVTQSSLDPMGKC